MLRVVLYKAMKWMVTNNSEASILIVHFVAFEIVNNISWTSLDG